MYFGQCGDVVVFDVFDDLQFLQWLGMVQFVGYQLFDEFFEFVLFIGSWNIDVVDVKVDVEFFVFDELWLVQFEWGVGDLLL